MISVNQNRVATHSRHRACDTRGQDVLNAKSLNRCHIGTYFYQPSYDGLNYLKRQRYTIKTALKHGPPSGLISDPESRTVLGARFAPVIEPRGRNIGVAKPLLDLGNIGLVGERVRGCSSAQRMNT
jgi:hypothetical protein